CPVIEGTLLLSQNLNHSDLAILKRFWTPLSVCIYRPLISTFTNLSFSPHIKILRIIALLIDEENTI
ncbi:hypothetical protein AB4524_00830, partial [Vibrio breoganii]